MRNNDGKISECSEDTAVNILKSKFTDPKKNKIFSLCGNLIDCESIFSLKLFLEKIGLKNYDCRQIILFYSNKRSSYFNSQLNREPDL